ncbi:MAG TPA: DUF11 domain-containing protein [Blastocatellia bacterium]|nr:DUF11 domain-containing protein [Blastocatellia bacterium]
MAKSAKASPRWLRLLFDLLLGAFLFGLFLIVWLPPGGASSAATGGAPANVMPMQGTSIIANISGSISTTDPTFTGPRHFRSGIPGDRICQTFSAVGARHYDQYFFTNTSPTSQRVSVAFISGCGGNTYETAYSPQFDPTNICNNYLAGAGVSGSTNWEFTVCGNSTFSILVYGLEPGVTCGSYQLAVGGTSAIAFNDPFTNSLSSASFNTDGGPFTRADQTPKQLKRQLRALAHPHGSLMPRLTAALPEGGTPLVASITDSIDLTEPTFTGPRHLENTVGGIPVIGSPNCITFGPVGTRHYDEYFFMNDSPASQKVYVSFTTSCGLLGIFMAAYSPQFDPNNICANYLGGVSGYQTINWEFTVCPNSQFSIVVYNTTLNQPCANYSYQVYGNDLRFVGTQTDVGVTKVGPAGPVAANSDITYDITVSNNGPAPANNVVFTDPLPPGTTFQSLTLLTSYGTGFTPPTCTTPPVGGTGTVTCTTPTLPSVPGTGIPTSLEFALTLHITPSASPTLTNTATVAFQGIDTNPTNNVATASVQVTSAFDICLQDDSTPSTVLLINSHTGDYRFCCNGTAFAGKGTLTIRGSTITLQHNTTDRRVQATVDLSVFKGSAALQTPPGVTRCTITDRDVRNNTCNCP